MQTDFNKILERIQKLHNKAESAKAIGSEHEALEFAAAVQKMLIKYQLEMSDVEAAALDRSDPVKAHWFHPSEFGLPQKSARVLWMIRLAQIVAYHHQCGIIQGIATNSFMLVGRRQNRSVAEHLIVVLTRFAATQSQKDYVTHFYQCKADGDVTKARGYKQGWLTGFVYRLAERYQAERDKLEREAVSQGTALVRLKDQLVKVQEVVQQIADGVATPLKQRPVSEEGLEAGMSAADGVALDGQQLSGSPGQAARVGAGQKLIGSGA